MALLATLCFAGPSVLDLEPDRQRLSASLAAPGAEFLLGAALARAVLAHPLFLVCDEPSSQLDLVVQTDVLDLVAEFAREDGVGVLLIAHDPAILRRYAHRAFRLLAGGQLVELPDGAEIGLARASA